MLGRSLVVLTLVVVLAGCGETSLIGRRVDNFTAYYNTFYNARKSFDRGVTALEGTPQPVSRDHFLAVYPAPEGTGSRRDFDDAIKRSADVLRDHPRSRWIDDAVMMIGQSYFYQQNYPAAAQKFREAIALDTGLQDEARLWLARSLIVNGDFARAAEHLDETFARESINRRVLPQLHLIHADLLVQQQDWAGAIDALTLGVRDVRSREEAARGWYLLGQVHEHVGEYDEARMAFERVTRLSASFELDYAARLQAALVSAPLQDRSGSVDGLRRLERDAKYSDRRAQIAHARGQAYHQLGEIDRSLETYYDVLYSGEYDVSRVRGPVHYDIAVLFRDEYGDYLLAAAHFDTAATALQNPQRAQAQRTPLPTHNAILDSQQQADAFRTYARVYSDIARMDSLLHLATLSDEEFGAFIVERRRALAREVEARRREEERLRMEQQFVQPGTQQANTPPTESAAVTSSAGFLFHRDPVRVQEGRLAFTRRWGDRPLVPAWRRADAVAAHQQARTAEDEPTTVARRRSTDPLVEEDLPMIDFSDVPRDERRAQRMRADLARSAYELGNVLFLTMDEPARAVTWYRRVLDEQAEPSVRGRAFYALAEVMRADGDVEQANRLYREVLANTEDPEIVARVNEYLGIGTATLADSSSLANDEYERAFRTWQRGQLAAAYESMARLAMSYRDTDAAPRALMAAGQIGLEWIRRDSLSFFDPLPVVFSDSLLQQGGLADSSATSPVLALGILPDSLSGAGQTLTVSQILSHLADAYDSHPFAEQARGMLTGLDERRPVPLIDETVDLAPEALAVIGVVVSVPPPRDAQAEIEAEESSVGPPVEVVSTRGLRNGAGSAAGDSLQVETTDVSSAEGQPLYPNAIRGEGSIEFERGGWAISVSEFTEYEEALTHAAELGGEGFLAGVHRPEGAEMYTVVVGHFESEALATRALVDSLGELPGDPRTVRIGSEDSP
jgi:cellulose synthase operon protein C